jgi:hypothetical protein
MSESREQIISLTTICNGAAVELFDHELQKVVANIADVNTSPKASREIVIKVTIKPDEGRQLGFASLNVSSKLAGTKPVESKPLYFGKVDGKPVAVTQNYAQPSMFDDAEKSNVQPIREVKQGETA